MISVIMGSASDSHIAEKVTRVLKEFEVDFEVKVISAHRALNVLNDYVDNTDSKVFIAMAGKAAHLAGVIAGITVKPVIGIPIKSSTMDGLDSLLSTVQMPRGIPVGTVAIDGGENAALLAISMLGIEDNILKTKLVDYRKKLEEEVIAADKELNIK